MTHLHTESKEITQFSKRKLAGFRLFFVVTVTVNKDLSDEKNYSLDNNLRHRTIHDHVDCFRSNQYRVNG